MSRHPLAPRFMPVALLLIVAIGCTTRSIASEGPSSPMPSVAATMQLELPAARTLLVDTDVAPDDLIALSFLVSAPNVTLAGITVSGTGEAHCVDGVRIVLQLLDRLGAPEMPVTCGWYAPLAGEHAFPDSWRQAADGGSNLMYATTKRTADPRTAKQLIDDVAAHDPGVVILTLGPLTNLGDAVISDAQLLDRVGQVYVMGGAVHVPGNLIGLEAPTGNAAAEWNIYIDPHAAQIVLDAGLQPAFISLDGTNQVPITSDFVARIGRESTAPGALVLKELFDANPFMTTSSYRLWDPLAAELAAGYPVGTFTPIRITVEEAEGSESGATRPTAGTANSSYLGDVDAAQAERTLFDVLNAP